MKLHPDLPQSVTCLEPMLPETGDPALASLSQRIFVEAGALRGALPSAITRRGVALLVREMNSY